MSNSAVLYNKFSFKYYNFNEYHYTDCRCGATMNYLAVMLNGSSRIVSADKTIIINEGDVFFIPKGLCYQSFWRGTNKISFHSYGFSNTEACEKIDFDLQIISCPKELKDLIISIPADGQRLKCKTLSLFYNALSGIIPYAHHSLASKKDELVEKAKSFILSNTNLKISEIAAKCYISEPYLYAIFKEKTGYTPNDFRLKALCQKGIEYLSSTDKTVEEISSLIGLSSASHFRKILKKYIGSTPREIRISSEF